VHAEMTRVRLFASSRGRPAERRSGIGLRRPGNSLTGRSGAQPANPPRRRFHVSWASDGQDSDESWIDAGRPPCRLTVCPDVGTSGQADHADERDSDASGLGLGASRSAGPGPAGPGCGMSSIAIRPTRRATSREAPSLLAVRLSTRRRAGPPPATMTTAAPPGSVPGSPRRARSGTSHDGARGPEARAPAAGRGCPSTSLARRRRNRRAGRGRR
jgi:hypothetical protein